MRRSTQLLRMILGTPTQDGEDHRYDDVKMMASIVDGYRLLVIEPRRMTYIETLTSARVTDGF